MSKTQSRHQVSPAVRITPNLPAIVNPDQNAESFRTRNIPDALVIGCKATVDLSTLANIAQDR